MLRVLSSPRTLCDGLTRRDLLEVGGASLFGLSLGNLLSLQSAQASPSRRAAAEGFGKAKRCIILFLYGSPSQLETFDMKPEAPVEIRGTMKPIPSVVPGLSVCEHMPHIAKMADRVTVVRSMTHAFPIHGVAYATTGIPAINVSMELSPFDPAHHPYFGSVVEYLDRRKNRHNNKPGSVQNVGLPFPFSSKRSDQPLRAGPYGAFLGSAYNPVWTEYVGHGTKTIRKARTGFEWTGKDPYLGCTADSHFRVSATTPQPEMTIDRLNRRRSLLEQFDSTRRDLESSQTGKSLSSFQNLAFSLISSPKVAKALDVRSESRETRELYGMTLFGQASLAARRLLEADTKLVSVFWDEYGLAGDAWDTHFSHYPRMKEQLLPQWDRAYSGLILDLERRGMLEDTLVVCISEHGRTPKLANVKGAGRNHWSRAYSAVFAGGGMAKGKVIGASDKYASDVADRPVNPKDILATMYHALGIDPRTKIPDRTGREIGLVPDDNDIVPEMFG